MQLFDRVRPSDLERRETQLTVFACAAIGILAIGTAVLMYPLVFARQTFLGDNTPRIAFFGFCSLSLLLSWYLWDRQRTIQRLRREIVADRKRVADQQRQASIELLKTMPNLSSFQDRLPMEYRRTVATTHKLSILVAMVQLPPGVPASDTTTLLGDAAKVISRRLRQQDSIYMLGPACFCAVLPGADIAIAEAFSTRVTEGLSDAAGAGNRFSYKVRIINYPAHASSAHELEQAVCGSMPVDNSMSEMAQAIV